MTFDLDGKVAVVTGGSRGIGRAIVDALADAGADVVIASRKLDACRLAARDVADRTGRRAEAVACHVGHWDQCDALVDTTLERMGRLDFLVSNAGMSPLYPTLDAVTEELWDKTVAVNLAEAEPPGEATRRAQRRSSRGASRGGWSPTGENGPELQARSGCA